MKRIVGKEYTRCKLGQLLLLLAVFCVCRLCISPVSAQATISSSQNKKLIVGVSEWAPYNGYDLPGHGLLTDIVQVALTRAGYDSTAEKMPWSRVIKGASRGEIDIIPGIWYKEKRAKTIAYGPVLAKARLVLISHPESPYVIETLNDLNHLRVGIVKDYAYPQHFLNATHFIKDLSPNLDSNLSKLARGRIDAALGDELVARHTTYRLFEGMIEFRYSRKVLGSKDIFLGISKANPDHERILDLFEKALADMKADGTYDAILTKHNITQADRSS
ncbi:substrate-binding periplasmic protein [Kiloniella majae]|uniref:substrate-binding periplasmic protein n=1 Tax=Kiloniella majae TaxID=1938558 RepID=UPI000A27829B|nr:transporter substrate-binding domain-containing protein [Kiloniella majae]